MASAERMQHPFPARRFVDPKVLARIGNLELLARTVVDGFINGLHRAPYFGASIDFAEHRGYVPGDDIRRVDWRLYARTDRFYVKQYEADTNANFSVLLDVSASMGFGSQRDHEARVRHATSRRASPTSRIASATASASSPSTATIVDHVPPSAKHFDVVLHTLDRARRRAAGQLARPLAQGSPSTSGGAGCSCSSRTSTRSPTPCSTRVKPLRFLGNDLIVFHVLDPAEIDFGYDEASSFQDLETGEELPVVPESFADEYRHAHAASTSRR